MPNVRTRSVLSLGESLAVTLPPDWIRGHQVKKGDRVELVYDEEVRIRSIKNPASAAEGRNPGGPAAQPAQPAKTDGEIVSHAG